MGITSFATPPDLCERAKTQSALRALLFIKASFPKDKFLSALHFLFYRFWSPPNADVVDEGSLRTLLAEATETPGGGARLFTKPEVDSIMDGRAKMKKKLAEDTARLVESGAFGCPWFLVADSKGEEVQPFFGSDRYAPGSRRAPAYSSAYQSACVRALLTLERGIGSTISTDTWAFPSRTLRFWSRSRNCRLKSTL